METTEKKITITVGRLVKGFFGASQRILQEPSIHIVYGNRQYVVGYPEYVGIAQGKVMQKIDFNNFAKDFSKSVNLAKIKTKNGKTATTE